MEQRASTIQAAISVNAKAAMMASTAKTVGCMWCLPCFYNNLPLFNYFYFLFFFFFFFLHAGLCNSFSPTNFFFSFSCIDIDECQNQPCQNGGTCQNEQGGYKCSCKAGFQGKNCENGKENILKDINNRNLRCLQQPGFTANHRNLVLQLQDVSRI